MLPQEREILTSFLDRFSRIPPQTPDPEASALIRQAVRRPDAAYLLVQQALVQEIGLQQAEQRIQELEQELQAARAAAASTPTAQGKSSFLGGMLGGGGRRGGWSDAPVAPPAAPPIRSSWGGQSGPTSYASTAPMQQSGGGFGGFLASAAATAAGVAGGALLFQGVKNLMGGQNDTGVSTAGLNANDGGSFLPSATPAVPNTDNVDNSAFLSDVGTDQGNGGWGDMIGDSADSVSDWI
ncbi:DUF2076 domain-containing protein [Gammaproteobacteria bacterium]